MKVIFAGSQRTQWFIDGHGYAGDKEYEFDLLDLDKHGNAVVSVDGKPFEKKKKEEVKSVAEPKKKVKSK